ncbi:hypothetical protein [Novosphingobium pentaromativorans]|uniref:Helix-turn-helix domain-containing protein n=1 Tax=Novosphingobium pentaromativorans US6-1 TaxID=1088721 RepID=G6E8X7_9SPHN|nr:hypothetical protein [Novosphingobium pentaromativorans]AIT81196.1 hypothetical protein JI59_16100 [Novosphingobium pentaromativorans US6-1]EHJ62201.1 helix-turn-helix domain-containing protein [Novosphingobium pentaromativorans US6-1]
MAVRLDREVLRHFWARCRLKRANRGATLRRGPRAFNRPEDRLAHLSQHTLADAERGDFRFVYLLPVSTDAASAAD